VSGGGGPPGRVGRARARSAWSPAGGPSHVTVRHKHQVMRDGTFPGRGKRVRLPRRRPAPPASAPYGCRTVRLPASLAGASLYSPAPSIHSVPAASQGGAAAREVRPGRVRLPRRRRPGARPGPAGRSEVLPGMAGADPNRRLAPAGPEPVAWTGSDRSSCCLDRQVSAWTGRFLPGPAGFCLDRQLSAWTGRFLPGPAAFCLDRQHSAWTGKFLPGPAAFCLDRQPFGWPGGRRVR
jgi:hypothetical protein